jgi:hypothetical protein
MINGDLAPTFSYLYPELLAGGGLEEGEFRRMVEQVNNRLIAAWSPWKARNVVDALLGVLTGWVWEDVGATKIKKEVRDVEKLLEDWNREAERRGVGARWVGLGRSGFLTVSSAFYFAFPLLFSVMFLLWGGSLLIPDAA